jgi:glycosyltransferase involved in cell wall biosynthesis
LKILVVHNHYRQRGGEDVVFQLEVEMLRARGHTVATYSRSNDEIRLNNPISKLVTLKNTIWSETSHREITSLLDEIGPDVVHVHNTFPLISLSIYSACAESRVPVIQTLHNYRMYCSAGTFFRDGRICETCVDGGRWHGIRHGCYRDSRAATAAAAFIQSTHRHSEIARYIALTPFSQAKFIQNGIQPGSIRVKPNFVHPDPGSEDGPGHYALFAGRLSPEKCAGTVLDAWSRINEIIPLLIVGGGPELETLRREACRRNLKGVHFLGQTPRQTALTLMRAARFLVFSSGWYESFPLVIAESFACGRPVLCPKLGAMRDIVSDHRTGLHYDPANAAELAEKVLWAWTHPKELRRMGKEAREEYESKYTAEMNYPILLRIYEEAIREHGARPIR